MFMSCFMNMSMKMNIERSVHVHELKLVRWNKHGEITHNMNMDMTMVMDMDTEMDGDRDVY